ncbi:MAG: hypothetical protein WB762_17715 [Candidatus Sulfotelmatobacter sp.]
MRRVSPDGAFAVRRSHRDNDRKAVGFTLPVAGKELTTMGSDSEIDADVMAVARSGTLIADYVAENMKGKIPPEKLARFKSENVDYPENFHLPPGNYILRFVVRDNQRGRMGSVHCSRDRGLSWEALADSKRPAAASPLARSRQ